LDCMAIPHCQKVAANMTRDGAYGSFEALSQWPHPLHCLYHSLWFCYLQCVGPVVQALQKPKGGYPLFYAAHVRRHGGISKFIRMLGR